MDRAVLGDFLRRKRLGLCPSDVGLDPAERRRTAGVRREEVAGLAHISTNFYTRLEQGRGSRPSEQTIAALARSLQLTAPERDHLFELAGHTPPRRAVRSERPSPGLLQLLAHIHAPAQIVTDLGTTLAQNSLARALVGDQTRYTGPRRSIVYRWFTDPSQRAIHPDEDHAEISGDHVASVRAVRGAPGDDQEADELVALLREESEEFAALWDRHEVGNRSGTTKRFVHPVAGTIALTCHILTGENDAERLVVFSPAPGSEDAQRLALVSRTSADHRRSAPADRPLGSG